MAESHDQNIKSGLLAEKYFIVILNSVSEMAESHDEIIKNGDIFHSYAELEEKINEYQRLKCVQFWRRDARLIGSARKRVTRPLNEVLKYYDIRYCCVHGGKTFKKRGNGERKTSTLQQCCPAFIHLSASADGDGLVVRSMSEEHSHTIDKEVFRHLPQQRKLPSDARDDAAKMLQLKANKKLVQHHLMEKTGIVITLKDLSNLAAQQRATEVTVEESIEDLQAKYGATVDVNLDSKRCIQGLIFQDERMKQNLAAYPEILCLDATYKLLECRLPVYILLCEDGMGNSEVVAVGLLAQEDAVSLTWFLERLLQRNPKMSAVRVFMTDKDLKERNALRAVFPSAVLLICLFHTLRTFRREVTCEKMGITSAQRTLSLELLQKIAYAKDETSYEEAVGMLQQDSPPAVYKYFVDNWADIRCEWVVCFAMGAGNYMNLTNNRLENLNSKLKSVISRFSTFDDFISKLFVILNCLRLEIDHKAAERLLKVPTSGRRGEPSLKAYEQLLTPYAYDFISQQMSLATGTSRNGQLVTLASTADCSCSVRKAMQLPCRHIFSERQKENLDLFDPTLCSERWHMAYFRNHSKFLSTVGGGGAEMLSINVDTCPTVESSAPLGHNQKFKKALEVCTTLASLSAEVGTEEFYKRLGFLQKLEQHWRQGRRLCIRDVTSQETDLNDVTVAEVEAVHGTNPLESATPTETVTGDSDVEHTVETTRNDTLYNDVVGLQTGLDTDFPDLASATERDVDQHREEPTVTDSTNYTHSLKGITLPKKVKVPGRPRGLETTVIGLSRKKDLVNKPKAFKKKTLAEKVHDMLLWFVSGSVAKKALDGSHLIEAHQVESRPDKVSHGCLDKNVDIDRMRRYFLSEAWNVVTTTIGQMREQDIWLCDDCKADVVEKAIECDSCLQWYHLKCEGLKKEPKTVHWFCRECCKKANNLQRDNMK